jgi:hypothetical protein
VLEPVVGVVQFYLSKEVAGELPWSSSSTIANTRAFDSHIIEDRIS